MEALHLSSNLENSAAVQNEQLEFMHAKANYQMAAFSKALPVFQKLAQQAWAQQRYDDYVEIVLFIIRILLEQDRKDELPHLVSKLEMILSAKDITPAIVARAHYTIGILNLYFPHGADIAKEKFLQSISQSLASENNNTLAYGLYGIATFYFEKKEWALCLLELEKLQQILSFHPNPELTVAALLLRGFVYYWQDQCKTAIHFLQAACEQLKNHPNSYLFLRALNALGSTHMKMKEHSTAQIYLELAMFSCPQEELPLVYKLIMKNLNQCRTEMGTEMKKLVSYDPVQGVLAREGAGSVSFQSQFVLRDLLSLLIRHPGQIFSKEDLVEKVWKEKYSPLVHDNKIYVTMKRLRQQLAPLFPDMESVLRHRDGYSLNQQLTAHIRNGDN